MKKRRTADQIARMLKDADRELARRLTVPDVCRKLGIAQATYYRGRPPHDPARAADDRRRRAREAEVERLKLPVAELRLDKRMLRDRAGTKGGRRIGSGRRPTTWPGATAPRRGGPAGSWAGPART